MRKIILLIFFLFNILSLSIFPKNIFILNSYHQTLGWTDSIVNNIIKNLPDEKFFIEYLDSKRFNKNQMFKIFKYFIKEKYKNFKLDLIIVTDNNALTFVVNNKKKLFKNIPVLFCGINNFEPRLLKGYKDITGVVEDVDIKGTIEGILRIHPNIKNIIALMGANFTSQLYFYKVVNLQYLYKDRVNIIVYNGLFYNKKEYTEALRNIPKNSVILYLNLFKLRDGTIFGIKDSIKYVFDNTHKPIYLMWDVMMNFPGVVGGKITSSRLQALSVVNYAKKILYKNIPIEKLPVITKSPSEYIFDYKELKRFNIPLNRLPQPYRLINNPSKLYIKLKEKEKSLFYAEIFVGILLLLFFALLYNIKKRREIEKQLANENQQFLTLLDGTNDIIVLKSPDEKWIYANKVALKFFGLKDVNFKGKTSQELINFTPFKKSIMNHYISDQEVWKRKSPIRFTMPLEKVTGEKYYIDFIKIPVFNKDGTKRCIIIAGRDITELKNAQDKLIVSQKMDIVGKLAGGVAHDFNNILTAITTNAEICSFLTNGNTKIEKYLKNILNATEKASNLVRHLLLFAKKDMGKKEILELNSALKSIIKLLKPSIPENIDFKFKPFDVPFTIEADPTHFEQIITNLIINAKDSVIEKKSDNKEIVIEIKRIFVDITMKNVIGQEIQKGEYGVIYIKDNGIGISDDIKNKIFDPFFTTKQYGTGLGLSTTLHLIERNKGFINFESKENEGTIFEVYFPIVKENEKSKDNVKVAEVTFIKKIDLNILFVEDNKEILNSIDEKFVNVFKKFIIAENGMDALNKIKGIEQEIDVLITDIIMPEMNGIELAKNLYKINKNIKIIFVSGYDSGKLSEDLNFEYKFFYKPYKYKLLLKAIEEFYS